MEVFYLRGDHAAAIAAWDACRDALRSAFGVAPSAATNALGRLLLAGDAAVAPGMPGAALALPLALRRPPQLVGRDAVLAAVLHSLALGHAVVLAGAGGIGKSRLLADSLARAAPAAAVLGVGARPGDTLLPGALLARLLGTALQRFAPPLDSTTQADVQRLLAGSGSPASDGSAASPLRSALAQRRVLGALVQVPHRATYFRDGFPPAASGVNSHDLICSFNGAERFFSFPGSMIKCVIRSKCETPSAEVVEMSTSSAASSLPESPASPSPSQRSSLHKPSNSGLTE